MNPKLFILTESLAVCRLPADATIPRWIFSLPLWSLTRTENELSLVLPENSIPTGWKGEHNWRALKVEGPLDFSLTGVLSSISTPLADAGISIFALSTYDTDMILVKADQLESAIQTLTQSGFEVVAPE